MAHNLVVVIATAGRPRLLHRTLDSLSACAKPAIYRETIVVENGPKGDVENIVRDYTSSLNARYLYVSLANKSHAVNQAVASLGDMLSTEDSVLIFFTDDDVRFHPGILHAYAEAAEGVESGIFYGGPTGVDYEQEPPRWLMPYLPNSARGWSYEVGKPITEQELFLGFNWAAFAVDIKAIAGFDTDRGPGAITGSRGMETAAQIRLLNHGLRGNYIPEAWVWHYVPTSRCSPEWTLHRAFGTGMSFGMNTAIRSPYSWMHPLWWAPLKIGKIFLTLMTDSARRHPHAVFVARVSLHHLRGYLKGWWLALQNRFSTGNL